MTNWTELKRLAEDTEGWQSLSDCWAIEEDDCDPEEFSWQVGAISEYEKYDVITVNTWQYDCPGAAKNLAKYYAAANPKTILALIAENERLRDDSHKNRMDFVDEVERRDQLRAEVEALRKDAERYRWLRALHGLSLKGHDFISYGEVADFRIDNAMTVVKADG